MSIFDEQWKNILENNAFSDKATITTIRGNSFEISGMFYKGSYDMGSSASYGAKTIEEGIYFQVSPLSLPCSIKSAKRDLLNAELSVEGKGLFKVRQIKGEGSGMLTLEIKPKEFSYA